MVVVFFIPINAIRLLVVAVVLPATNLVLGVAVIIRGCLVGIATINLVSCVAVIIRGCLVQAGATTIGTRLVVAVRIIATLLVVVVW